MTEGAMQRSGPGGVWVQTWGIFVDAYREMNARKLFWIVMILSALVMAAFATIGATETSLTFLSWDISPEMGVSGQVLYKLIFSYMVVGFYLTWVATGLALISTASIFPDFMTGGAVDLYLSKPIGRTRLFLTKYLAGLLFVAMQVAVFSLASFLVLGIRGRTWEPSLFLAIPIVVAFFSYLYGICVLFGVLTRSTLAALLLTILAWFCIWGVDQVDKVVTAMGMPNMAQKRMAERQIARVDQMIAEAEKKGTESAPATAPMGQDLESLKTQRASYVEWAERAEHPPEWAVRARPIVFALKTFVPKTRETTALLDRYLLPAWELEKARNEDGPTVQEIDPMRDRSAWWVVGSSLAFEAVCVGLAAWIFKRRDF
jgi:ABC-type transport system involved in multi-copper enzyme maturation permease subunit